MASSDFQDMKRIIEHKDRIIKEKDRLIRQKDRMIKEKMLADSKLDLFMDQIFHLLEKNLEFSDETKKDLEKAMKIPLGRHIPREKAEKQLLR